jgi:hypothetical protein
MSELVVLALVSAFYLALGVWVIRRTSESNSGQPQSTRYRARREVFLRGDSGSHEYDRI